MACVENAPPINNDSEMEEGEIVDDLSDISSEEEFLLRQRLQVLENYNNVLERKKAKKSSTSQGSKQKKADALLYDLSEISATELDDYGYAQITVLRNGNQRHVKTHHRQKKKKEEPVNTFTKNKEHKKNHRNKRKLEVKVVSESSEESEDEYRNRRRKLADAVIVNRDQSSRISNEKSSLSARLKTMLSGDTQEPIRAIITESKTQTDTDSKKVDLQFSKIEEVLSPVSSINDDHIINSEPQGEHDLKKVITNQLECIDLSIDDDINKPANSSILVDLCTDEDIKPSENKKPSEDTGNSAIKDILFKEHVTPESDKDSDEDLEMLRQHALKTKLPKVKTVENESTHVDNKILSEDEDSDTAELRLICLKSTILKKAIEIKRKQKLQKRLSQSSNLHDELLASQDISAKDNSENNTDIESVDMEIGSDADEKTNNGDESAKVNLNEKSDPEMKKSISNSKIPSHEFSKEDELEEDEDLLRAKLLTSLSKNISSLVSPNIINTIDNVTDSLHVPPKLPEVDTIPMEKRFIINLGESDSEGEHEATKNLTKMHIKLSEQIDFQQRLDIFLKSTRMAVEKSTLPDVVQRQTPPNNNEKFVAKVVNHLPKSEQIEYKNLVKRMAELEKIKQARQSTMNATKLRASMKETLKPRNVTIDTTKFVSVSNIDEQINLSRKKIAEESAKMLRLKEEGTKLSQKYKIVATELRNIKTALTLNKKQQMAAQNYLARIRLDHQNLLKSSKHFVHSKNNGHLQSLPRNPSMQKENNPSNKEYRNPLMQKTVKVSVVNDVKDSRLHNPRLSVQVDVSSNKKVVTLPQPKTDDEVHVSDDRIENKTVSSHPAVDGLNDEVVIGFNRKNKDVDDYKSPLDALGSTEWDGDPNAILCPFEVDGDCKDTDCKYLHTKTLTQ